MQTPPDGRSGPGSATGSGDHHTGGRKPRHKPRRRRAQPVTQAGPESESGPEPESGPVTGTGAESGARTEESAPPAAIEPAQAAPAARERSPRRQRPTASRIEHGDRQWRELAGSGRSQVSLDAALRARDADRPTAAELAQAEAETVVQHRNWTPSSTA